MFKLHRLVILNNCVLVNKNIVIGQVCASTKQYSNANSESIASKWSKTQNAAEYYAGKKVFITGGTGFLGKVLIERLLMTCSKIDTIYVLIRGKQGASVDRRLKQMFDLPLFHKLKQVNPGALNKLIPIEGDITETKLAISPDDEQKLIEDVSLVFHSAATVKFTDPFASIMKINLEGTRKVLELSKKIKNLETFVLISTAFSNSNRMVIEEMIYPPPKELDDVYRFLKKHGDDEKEVKKFLVGLPNTYTFSKALSETLVNQEHGDMPAIIVRPSIVTPAVKGSVLGWCDSWVAATALFSDVARGLTKVMYGHQNVICDMIPVDYVCNLAIVAAARGNQSKDVLIYNSCSSSSNPISWKHGSDLYLAEALKHGRSGLKPRPVAVAKSKFIVSLITFSRQTVPAFLADIWLRIKGQKPKHMKMQQRAILLRDVLKNFTSTSWLIKSNKSQELIDSMCQEEKSLFPCDPKTLVWKNYMPHFYNGVQNYLLKSNK